MATQLLTSEAHGDTGNVWLADRMGAWSDYLLPVPQCLLFLHP